MHHRALVLLLLALVFVGVPGVACASDTKPPDPNAVPSIDGGLGSCSVEFTVTDDAANPLYNAKIRVRILYGAFGLRKLDLEVGTNSNGKARFDGLPEKVRRPLEFTAVQGDRSTTLTHDPAEKCKASYTMVLKPASKD
jgi:hypothetical protein